MPDFQHTIANPWHAIAGNAPPYALQQDLSDIESFNATADAKHRIQLDVFPEPFIGDPAAPILILSLNSGFKPAQVEAHAQPELARLLVKSLRLEAGGESVPFHHLHPTYQKHSPSVWWPRCLKGWIERFGLERVSRSFFCVEFFPYASRTYKALPGLLESQRFGFAVARDKIAAGATVIAFRHKRVWMKQLSDCDAEQWITPVNLFPVPQRWCKQALNPPPQFSRSHARLLPGDGETDDASDSVRPLG